MSSPGHHRTVTTTFLYSPPKHRFRQCGAAHSFSSRYCEIATAVLSVVVPAGVIDGATTRGSREIIGYRSSLKRNPAPAIAREWHSKDVIVNEL
jgi:hypothetical protein